MSLDARSPFTEAGTGVAALLDGVEEPARGLALAPAHASRDGRRHGGQSRGGHGAVGRLEVRRLDRLDQKLRQRSSSPNPRNAEPANFGDFGTFFRPDGTLSGFRPCAPGRLGRGKRRRPVHRQTRSRFADADLLACLQRLKKSPMRSSIQPAGESSVQADWTAANVTAAKFWVGSKDTALPKAQWAGPSAGSAKTSAWSGGSRTVGPPRSSDGTRFRCSTCSTISAASSRRRQGASGIYASDCPPLTLKLRCEGDGGAACGVGLLFSPSLPQSVRVVSPDAAELSARPREAQLNRGYGARRSCSFSGCA